MTTIDPEDRSDDLRFLAAALALGRRGLGTTSPNPAVGALVVKDGVIVGRGWTDRGGRPHAETVALERAGVAATGATIYVSLEPCSHHGHTGPCCEAIVSAGISRLVYTIDDPNPLVAGRGASYCREHGIAVASGLCAEAARRDHRGHICRVSYNRPAVTLKLAETADGFVAGGPHDPRLAITGAVANGAVHVMRAMHDAIMVGIGTVLADDPLMTVRLPGLETKPLRIVLDAALRIPLQSRLLRTASDWPVLLVIGEAAATRIATLAGVEGLEIAVAPQTSDGRLEIGAVLTQLADRGLTRIFSEGGPSVAAALIEGGFADDVLVITAPRPLCSDGVPTLTPRARDMLMDASFYRPVGARVLGADLCRHYERVA